ncbi:MAG: hypothetical protein LC804_16760 [Acidobacteria bacterium]|nr:hypothetical protein [Acidobacteriota bacterium]
MRIHQRALTSLGLAVALTARLQAETLIRWDQDRVPSLESLGISTLVVPARNAAAVRNAHARGYRVYLEVDASALAGFVPPSAGVAGVVVKGSVTRARLRQFSQRLQPRGIRVMALEERAKWPHIRSNWVTKNNEVLQVTGRSAQPWIENNAALLRILRGAPSAPAPLLTYAWEPITISEKDEGPGIDDYLVAIAEAGSLGGDLLLPLHEQFQKNLLLGNPQTRAGWNEIRRYMDFYSWGLASSYEPIANIGVVTAGPMRWFEVMNLLARHNLSFLRIAPAALPLRTPNPFKLLIVLDPPDAPRIRFLEEFARTGGTVVLAALLRRSSHSEGGGSPRRNPESEGSWRSGTPVLKTDERVSYRFGEGRVVEVLKGIADPNTFALEIRQMLGPDHRVIDVWNGITVLTAPHQEPNGRTVLVTALNYAHDPLPVQLRIPGTFSLVQYESPHEPPALLPHQHRNGFTEFVLPALHIGGRIFLTRVP